MLGVEQHDAKVLDRTGPEFGQEKRRRLARRPQLYPGRRRVRQRPATQLEGRDQLSRLRAADPGDPIEVVATRSRQPVQPAVNLQELVCQAKRSGTARSASEDERHQLVVAERPRATPLELLARSIVER